MTFAYFGSRLALVFVRVETGNGSAFELDHKPSVLAPFNGLRPTHSRFNGLGDRVLFDGCGLIWGCQVALPHLAKASVELRHTRLLALATSTPLPHNNSMVEIHPFSIRIENDTLSGRRFRWAICQGEQIILRSPHSYATRREAEKEAAEALKRTEARHRDK
jgi:hypothetical protein